MSKTFEDLIIEETFGDNLKERKSILLSALNQSYERHFKLCLPYRKFCQRRGFSSTTRFSSFEDFPYLPVQAFKEYGSFLSSFDNHESKKIVLQSSATSGTPSVVNIDKLTAKRQIQSLSKIMTNFIGKNRKNYIVIDIDPLKSKSQVVGARSAAIKGFLNFSNGVDYVLKENDDGFMEFNEAEFNNIIQTKIDENKEIIIFGFTYIIFEHILKRIKNCSHKLENCHLIHIGGWKKLEDQKVSKRKFNTMIENCLGIPSQNIIDVYGFTEQMGIVYPSFGEDTKITPNFAEVIVRDPVTLDPVEDGRVGLLEFITPLPNSYPGIAVATDDLGVITERLNTENRSGTRFKIIGRAKNAEIRGCGDIMSTYFISNNSKSDSHLNKKYLISLIFFKESKFNEREFLREFNIDKFDKIQSVDSLSQKLLLNRKKLDSYSIDEIISFLSIVSKNWLEHSSEFNVLRHEGLSFLVNWMDSKNLRIVADESLSGKRGFIDSFMPCNFNNGRKKMAISRGLCVHWVAGNVPLLGMLTLVQAIITKNANIIKAASSYSGILPALLKSISEQNIKLPTGKTVYGKDITSTIAVLYINKEDQKSLERLSKLANTRIAWGGAEAVNSILSLPKMHQTNDVVFGPKLSFMAIENNYYDDLRKAKKLAKRIAIDVSVFDQYACASPHTIFIEDGNQFINPKQFAKIIAEQLEIISKNIPKGEPDGGTVGNIQSIRMKYEFTEDLWCSKGTTWTVLYDDKGDLGPVKPTYSRVITVRKIDNIMKVAEFADHNTQTIGLGIKSDRKEIFCRIAGQNGAMRFPDIGRMTFFDSPWDGIYPMHHFVKWISLGGPII